MDTCTRECKESSSDQQQQSMCMWDVGRPCQKNIRAHGGSSLMRTIHANSSLISLCQTWNCFFKFRYIFSLQSYFTSISVLERFKYIQNCNHFLLARISLECSYVEQILLIFRCIFVIIFKHVLLNKFQAVFKSNI